MANKWTGKSIMLANAPGYLDALSEIYEMQVNPERPISTEFTPKVRAAFGRRDSKELIRLLLEHAEVFPVKDSYIGFLRAKPTAIHENPKTVQRIAERLYSLGSVDAVLGEAQRPKETNRQLGSSFKKWLHGIGYDLVDEEAIMDSTREIKLLKGDDRSLADFAKKKLRCKLKKGIDLVMKVDRKYIIGEAKFLTTPGGEQDRGFDDAYDFVSNGTGNAVRIALIDGYVWLKTMKGLHNKIVGANRNILSALILKEFVENL